LEIDDLYDFISFVDNLDTSSIMSSSTNREQMSSGCRHRSLNDIRHLGTTSTDGPCDGCFLAEQRSRTQAIQLANRLQHLQVNSDINTASTQAATSVVPTLMPCLQNESLAEEELIERLKQSVNQFMTRPGRRYSYNITMRWTVDHGNQISYSVVVSINQPSDLI
jgi:hypothetical protein